MFLGTFISLSCFAKCFFVFLYLCDLWSLTILCTLSICGWNFPLHSSRQIDATWSGTHRTMQSSNLSHSGLKCNEWEQIEWNTKFNAMQFVVCLDDDCSKCGGGRMDCLRSSAQGEEKKGINEEHVSPTWKLREQSQCVVVWLFLFFTFSSLPFYDTSFFSRCRLENLALRVDFNRWDFSPPYSFASSAMNPFSAIYSTRNCCV